MNKIEELPSGRRVLYVDISNLAPNEANKYINEIMIMQTTLHGGAAIDYVIPVREPSTATVDIFTIEATLIAIFTLINTLLLIIELIL